MKYSLLRKEACEAVIQNLKDNRGPYTNEVGVLVDSMNVIVKELDRITFIIDNGYEPEVRFNWKLLRWSKRLWILIWA
jgi:hypothetical protein